MSTKEMDTMPQRELSSELVTRVQACLEQPESPRLTWNISTHFIADHDIVALIGFVPDDLTDSAVSEGDASTEVVSSVISALIERGLLHSARDCDASGLATCIARCCVEGSLGCFIALDDQDINPNNAFAEVPGCVVVSFSADQVEDVADVLDDVDLSYSALGQIGGDRIIVSGMPSNRTYIDFTLSEL